MGQSKAKAEAIQLVRSLPRIHTAWIDARWGRLRQLRGFRPCFVEMRDCALLIYPPQGSGRAEKDEHELISDLSPKYIEMVPLREARVVHDDAKKLISIRKPDLSGTVDLRIEDSSIYADWKETIRELVGLRHVTLADFEIERHVGKGASGRVYLVEDKETREHLALKVIEKSSVYESEDSYRHALDERIVLELATSHPFILDMRYAFQNRERLFIVTEYCGGGDLFEYLSKKSRPMEECKARYIVAEILLAIEHIHSLGVVYRDLKLENVLLDEEGHIRVADFGLSKMLARGQGIDDGPKKLTKTKTFCGTREYVAPEMLAGDLYDTSVDLWAFGILLYEILCGRTPFYSRQRNEIYERIEKSPVFYPKDMSDDVQDLLKGLLERKVDARMSLADVKLHPWFSVIDWDSLKQMKPHLNSIKQEIRQMNCGKGGAVTPSAAAKKSKRQLAEEKAMQILKDDAANDVKAIGRSSPRTNRISQDGLITPGRQAKVVPVTTERKRTPIIAGYSFVGEPPSTGPVVQKLASREFSAAAYHDMATSRGNAYDCASEQSDSVQTDSVVTEDIVPDKTAVQSAQAIVPALQKMHTEDMDPHCDDLLSPASPHHLDDLADKLIETRRESKAPRPSMGIASPSIVLRRRHQRKMEERQRKLESKHP